MKETTKVALIGAGLGGLSAAVRLASQGFEVEVFEKAEAPGGRCGRLEQEGFVFDTGPTILLMPEVLEALFASAGRRLEDYLTLVRCAPNYRIHFRDGADLTFSTDLVQMRRELERIEPGAFARYLAFIAKGHDQYTASLERFVGRNFDGLRGFLTPGNIKKILAIKALRPMYREVSRYFTDERLRAAMTFQTMYLGISPYEAPAVYGLLPYTELAMGIWFPRGGMYAIVRALERLCRELGVRFHYGAAVKKIAIVDRSARGLVLDGGEHVAADAVLCNADLPWAYRNLIDPHEARLKNVAKLRYTASAFLFYWGVGARDAGLMHHNVFFGRDYRASFDDIFKRHKLPDDLSFYVNVPSRTDDALAPKGKDSVYVLVPAPATPGADWKREAPLIRERVLGRLAEEGIDLASHIEVERTCSPSDFASGLNLERGAAFGLSHNFMQVGPFRPRNVDKNVANLFFVGASTQPGTGVPMVMLSARLVAERLAAWAAANGRVLQGVAPAKKIAA